MNLKIKNALTSMTSKEKVDLLSYIMDDEHVSIGDVASAISCSSVDADDLVSKLIDCGFASDPLEDVYCSAYDIDRADYTSDLSFISKVLEAMPPYELKKALCDALWVGTYCDNKALEEKLKDIVNA